MSKGNLYKTKTYLIGSMQYACGRDWRENIYNALRPLGIKVLDPYKKPFLNPVEEDEQTQKLLEQKLLDGKIHEVRNHMKKVRALDLSMVDKSDFIICYLRPDVPTFGTIEELTVAVKARKPVFTVVEGGITKTPLWITAMLPEKQLFNNFENLIEHIKNIDSGKTEADPKYWRLLDFPMR